MSQNLMWGLLAPCRTQDAETFVCAQSTWQGQTASQISASYLCASCSYANMYYVPKNGVFGGVLRVKVWKYCLLTPKRHYPAWIRVWGDQQRPLFYFGTPSISP